MINHEYGMKTPICKYIVFFWERQAKTAVLPKFSGSFAESGIIFNPHKGFWARRASELRGWGAASLSAFSY